MTARVKFAMTIPRIAHGDTLHYLAQWLFANLHQNVQVVPHPTECVNTHAELADRFLDDLTEHLPIPRRCKQRLAMIATQNRVIATARNMQTRKSRHPCPPRQSH
jgi:hypothetical protein